MELVTIILSGLLSVISPVGLVAESAIADSLRDRVRGIEELKVRLDNIPSYRIIDGKVDRLRLSSRGIQVNEDLRIASLDLETDPLHIDLQGIQAAEENENLAKYLERPVKVAINIGFTETDLNVALRSTRIRQLIEDRIAELLPTGEESKPTRLKIEDLQIDLSDNNRLSIVATVENPRSTPENPSFSQINLEFGLSIANGRTLEIIEPTGRVNDRKLRESLLRAFTRRFATMLDLQQLESAGIFVRVLQLKLEPDRFNCVTFIQIDPQ